MQFPIIFKTSRGSGDYVAPVINFVGNTTVAAVGGAALAAIALFAVQHAGYSSQLPDLLLDMPTCVAIGAGVVCSLAALVSIGKCCFQRKAHQA